MADNKAAQVYVLAAGVSYSTRRGIVSPGEEIRESDFGGPGGPARFADLIRRGKIVKASPPPPEKAEASIGVPSGNAGAKEAK